MASERPPAILLRIKQAQAAGMAGAAFLRQLSSEGLGYRKQTFQADWRNVGNIAKKEGAYRYVRKDRRPTAAIAQVKGWKLSQEYMHKVKVWTRLRPGEKPVERFVNVMGDKPMTPQEVEQAILDMLPEWRDSIPGVIDRIVPFTIIQRAP